MITQGNEVAMNYEKFYICLIFGAIIIIASLGFSNFLRKILENKNNEEKENTDE